ncbi:hypothetical protein PQR39_35540 [Paraburkholderia sediminicola]|uniref:hypothetical protein n=1 Tax=Paraburkholderia sediminicola TaxID=458836 RepID=UPI0038BDE922
MNLRPISQFLADVETIVTENVFYERRETELLKSNREFSEENIRLNANITAQAGTIEDHERRLANQSISIGNYQTELGNLKGQNADLTGRLERSIEANQTWEARHSAVKTALDSFERQVSNSDSVIQSLRAQLTAKDALLNAAGRDLETLRERTTGFQEELSEAQRKRQEEVGSLRSDLECAETVKTNLRESVNKLIATRDGLQQRVDAFDGEATRLREELAEERAERRQEAANAAAQIEAQANAIEGGGKALDAMQHNFRMADRALSCRNDTIWSLEKLLSAKEEERRLDVATLKGVIAEKEKTLTTVRANATHWALEAASAQRAAGRESIKLGLYLHADGSVSLQTDSQVVVTSENVVFNGNVSVSGALSS